MRRALFVCAAVMFAGCPEPKDGQTTDAGWNGGGGGGGGGGSAQALAESKFVFVREVRPGVHYLLTHDTATSAEAVLSNLDDDGQTGTGNVTGLALSPDRKLVAFSALLRATAADKENPSEAVWTVTADGKTLARQTPAIPHPGTACTTDANCVSPQHCNTLRGHCERSSFVTHVYSPVFTADQRSLYFHLSQTWIEGMGTIAGGGGIWSVPLGGGAMESYGLNADCSFVDLPAISPSGATMIVEKGVCLQSHAGYYQHTVPPQGGLGAAVFTGNDTIGWNSAAPVFWDETHVFLLGPDGVVFVDLSQGTSQDVLTAGADQVLGPCAVSPDGSKMVVCVYENQGSDLYLVDLTSDAPVVQLTTDGQSCTPAW